MPQIRFHKYHGLENDFIVIETSDIRLPQKQYSFLSEQICTRHTGIGADGVIFFSDRRERFIMRIFNADGSEAEISGNGLRVLAQYIYQRKLCRKRRFTIHARNGENQIEVISSRGLRQITRIDMKAAGFALPQIPMRGKQKHFINQPFQVNAGELIGTAVNVGNPHMVFFVDSFDFDWQTFGSQVEIDRCFPERVNVEFAIIKSRRRVLHRSWERGAGETRASGTGAASVVAAGVISGLLDRKVDVHEPAGKLHIEWGDDDHLLLTGPSQFIGDGVLNFRQ